MQTAKISVRLPADLLGFLDRQVEQQVAKGLKWDRTDEVTAALRQREISFLTVRERRALYAKLGIKRKREIEDKEPAEAGQTQQDT